MSGNVITPSHFLSLRPNLIFPEFINIEFYDPDFVSRLSSTSSVLQKWKKGQALVQESKSTWQRDYLLSLRERPSSGRHKRGATAELSQIGKPVLIGADQPRGSWKVGVIEQIHPGKDGIIRVATVRSMKYLVKRPVSALYALECESVEAEVPALPIVPPIAPPIVPTPRASLPAQRASRKTALQSRAYTRALRDPALLRIISSLHT